MFIYESRASVIIYNILKNLNTRKTFLIPSNVCPIVVTTLLKVDVNFEFVDIEDKSLSMDGKIIINKIKANPKKYAGIIFVRTYGTMTSFEELFSKIKSVNPDIFIIDDRCLTIPTFVKEKTYADIQLYSTGYSKFIDLGFGGYAITKDGFKYRRSDLPFNKGALDRLISDFRQFGNKIHKYDYVDTNWLDTSIPKKFTFAKYRQTVESKLPQIKKIKKQANRIYIENLPKKIQLPPEFQWWRFNIIVPEKQLLIKKIFTNGLFASSHYQSLSNIFSNSHSKNAERLYSNVINLFNDQRFDRDKAIKITNIINKHLN